MRVGGRWGVTVGEGKGGVLVVVGCEERIGSKEVVSSTQSGGIQGV